MLATTRFDAAQSLEDTLSCYVRLYNHHFPQRALGHIVPVQALKDWQEKCSDFFQMKVYKLTGLDTRPGTHRPPPGFDPGPALAWPLDDPRELLALLARGVKRSPRWHITGLWH